MAVICGAIANGGTPVEPTLIKSSTNELLKSLNLTSNKSGKELFRPDTASKLDELMRYTITGYYGDDLFGDLKVCAKTGTAEIGNGKDPNAWMVGYSKDEDCPLAFACVVEDSGFGIEYAGPVAEAAMKQAAQCIRGQKN